MNWLKELFESETDNQKIEQKIVEKLKSDYVAKSDYDVVVQTKQALEGQIQQRDTDIQALKESAKDNADLQAEYQKLEKKYKADTANLQKQYLESRKNSAVDIAIMQAKGRNLKAIKALIDMEKVTLKEDGSIDGLDLDALKQSDGYLFDVETTKRVGSNSQKQGEFHTSADLKSQIEHSVFGE